ncbi:hypothetical protein SLEP1_g25617 [Rubroshorea leprosula]|uniref:Uncharacterized protein n=1 Tax=Rubroshorea leprosula TaxID=152421 RepID=A0AAV5JJD0_9ROSI|nr:hypothetical protein SLEP1_g25617 [Rubroshorea leprosula]
MVVKGVDMVHKAPWEGLSEEKQLKRNKGLEEVVSGWTSACYKWNLDSHWATKVQMDKN